MKRRFFAFAAIIAGGLVFASFKNTDPAFPEVAYPQGYRDWTHVKTYIVGPKSPAFKFIGGFNHVYANDKALVGYKTGHFPNGSMIISDVIEAKEDSMNVREGARHHIDVMVRDSVKYKEVGGWGFEEFVGTKRILTTQVRTACTNCHAKQKDFVFSEYRE